MPRLKNPQKTGSSIKTQYDKDNILTLEKGETKNFELPHYKYLRKVYTFLEDPDDIYNKPDAPFVTEKKIKKPEPQKEIIREEVKVKNEGVYKILEDKIEEIIEIETEAFDELNSRIVKLADKLKEETGYEKLEKGLEEGLANAFVEYKGLKTKVFEQIEILTDKQNELEIKAEEVTRLQNRLEILEDRVLKTEGRLAVKEEKIGFFKRLKRLLNYKIL